MPARAAQERGEALADGCRLDGERQTVALRSPEQPRHPARHALAGGLSEREAELISPERFVMSANTRELEDPLGLARAAPEEMEDGSGQRVALAERHEPAGIRWNAH